MRRGDASWSQHNDNLTTMLKQTQKLKVELDSVAQQASQGALHTWNHFDTCCSSMDQMGSVVAQMSSVEQLFTPSMSEDSRDIQPAITQSLQYVQGQVEASITEFTTWRTQLLSLGQQHQEPQPGFYSEFSAELETNIHTVLYVVQTLVKRKDRELQRDKTESGDEEEQDEGEEATEDLLKPGHLTRLLEAELEAQVEALRLADVTAGLQTLLNRLRTRRDSSQTTHLQEVSRACRLLVRLEPLLDIYSDLVRYYMAVSLGAHRTTGKLLSVLASIFTELAQKGFCLPQELLAGGDGEGATEFHDYEGGGMGEGEGAKDVSDKIENEDQVEDTFQEGQEKEEQQDKQNMKDEENAIEMSEDFDGQMHDADNNEPGEDEETDKEDDEELDKKMGDLGEGQTDTLDERMWGDDEDDEEEERSDKEEESGQGMDQGESELVANEDNLDAADPNKDKKNQDKDPQLDEEDKEKIHEQGDEREFDENEVDPYHSEQNKRPEPETMDLPEDLNLDQGEEDGDQGDEDEENPFGIDEKNMNVDEKEDKQEDGEEEADRTEEMEQEPTDQPGDEKEPENRSGEEEEEEGGEEEQEESVEKGQEEEEEEEGKDRGQEAGTDQDLTVPHDEGPKPKEDEGAGEEEEEAVERKEHDPTGQTGDENVQSDTAVEVAGEASERDQAKEEHGSGAADASQSEGHQSKMTARMALQRQTDRRTQSYKRKPGQADDNRSMGDYNQQINKRLRTVENSRDQAEDNRPSDGQQESDLYEHIEQTESTYDAQTYDVASADQQKAAGPQQSQDTEEHEDVIMETEDQEEVEVSEVQELKPEHLDSTKASEKGVDSGETDVQMQGEAEDKEDKWKDRQHDRYEECADRSTESTMHTVPELLLDSTPTQRAVQDPDEMRREMELQLEAWHKLPPGTQEEEGAAASMWHQYQALTSALSQQLCEQLRLILEPTQAAKLRGDYRTGKRLNMRKVIPYIASQFRKDKIWLRRTKPSKREYQICLAVDDSSSMVDNHSKQLAFESLSVIVNALTLLEVGQVSVYSFGEQVQLLHPFQQQFNDECGARILRLCQFQQKKTRIGQFLETSTKMLLAARHQIPGSTASETAQLLLIVSDGRGLFLEGKERVTAAVRAAHNANVFIIFVVLDNPNSRDSILDIKVPIFKGPGELPEIHSYMEEFPFPFYIILRDVNALPETLSDALRQWFELVIASDQ